MLKYRKNKQAPSFTTIEALFNKLGIPIILSSTTSGRDMFLSNTKSPDFTTTRRLLTDREYKFSVMELDSSSFQTFFDALFPEEFCTGGVRPGRQFKERFHYLTCGLPAMMTRLAFLHHETIVQLISSKPNKAGSYTTDNLGLLNGVYKNQFTLISNALDNIRAGNNDKYQNDFEKSDDDVSNSATPKHAMSNHEIKKLAKAKQKKQQLLLPDVELDPLCIPRVQSEVSPLEMQRFLSGGDND